MQTDEFVQAAREGDVNRLERLAAADPSLVETAAAGGQSALMAALYARQEAAAEWLADRRRSLDVFAAAALGREEALAAYLGDPAQVNAYAHDGWTPLHLAAFFGRRGAAERLLAAGAALDAVSRNPLRNTPLHAAVAGGHVDLALLLIEAGADVNATDAGRHTPFHLAAEAGYVPVARALFERGADAHAVDAEERTPLARAAVKGHAEIVDLINAVE